MAGVTPYFASLVVVATILSSILLFGWFRRHEPAVEPFLVLTVGVLLWTVGYALKIPATTESAYLLFDRVMWLGVVVTSPAWLVFTLDYTGRESVLTRRFVGFLAGLGALDYVLYLWNPGGAYYTIVSFSPPPPVASVEYAFGPLFWAHLSYLYVETLIGMGLLVGLLLTSTVYRRRAVALLVAVTVPVFANLFSIFEPVVLQVDPTPYSFAVSSLAVGFVLFDRQLFDSLPVTRSVTEEAIVSAFTGGIIVLDADERVVEYNEPAAAIVENGSSVYGESVESVLPVVADALTDSTGTTSVDAVLDAGEGRRHYSASISHVHRRDGTLVGHVVSLHDVTQRILREQRLDVLNRVLRHNVRQEATLVLGHTSAMDGPGTDQVTEAVENLVSLSDRARHVSDALDSAGHGPESVDLAVTVRESVAAFRDEQPSIDVSVTGPDSATAFAHPSVREAIDELLTNAHQHDPGQDPSVSVTVAVDADDVTVSVTDSGPPIPESERSVLADGGETALEHGDGLGLWLVNWLVTSSGGDVRFERETGGNRVSMSFPRAD
ncbi:histidine kinase N-terminal 7TM domain-containing protein [Haloarchaeobius sp. TZWWS8]|uniref:histidine kinase N-terminal 7TM domain-containing protein n=1 Tax=Haloarchaeobius sp. TZWWS8 TaxID=3446121 RepID=UPI003EBE4DFA